MPFAARADVRLSLVWFLYMAGFGLYFPYWSLYLKDNAGLPEAEAGLVIAVLSLMGIVAQPFWGQIADRTGSRTRVLTVAALGSAFGFCVLWQAHGFLPLLAANALFAAFHTAVLPMAVAVSLATLRDGSRHAFGIVRAIGTVGFVVTTFCFPRMLDAVQAARGWTPVPGGPREPGLELLFPTAAAITLCAVAVTFLLPRTGAVSLRAGRGDWRALARHRPYLRIAALCMAAYLFTNGPMLFFPQLVMARGGSLATVSNMWVPMIALEIPGLALSGVLVQRLGARGLIVVGLLAGGARWALCGFVPSMDVLYASCLLHGVTIAGLGMGAPLYAESVVPEKLRATGQGLLATSVHVGAMLSAALTGAVAGRFGIDVPYQAGGLATLGLALLVPKMLPPPRRPD